MVELSSLFRIKPLRSKPYTPIDPPCKLFGTGFEWLPARLGTWSMAEWTPRLLQGQPSCYFRPVWGVVAGGLWKTLLAGSQRP